MIGSPRVHHRVADSTNERAKALALTGAVHGTLVTAHEQTAGRGRQGRVWTARPGRALLMTVVVRGEALSVLPLCAAVAVADACDELASVEARIKWPNDVWLEGRKVSGILVEGRPQEGWAVLGIGLNVATALGEFPEELRDTATSLAVAGGEVSVESALAAVLTALDERLGQPMDVVLEAWRARDALRGRKVHWASEEGTALGIADSGGLLVETADGVVELDAGEVHLRRD